MEPPQSHNRFPMDGVCQWSVGSYSHKKLYHSRKDVYNKVTLETNYSFPRILTQGLNVNPMKGEWVYGHFFLRACVWF
jgi:hypothetical protein